MARRSWHWSHFTSLNVVAPNTCHDVNASALPFLPRPACTWINIFGRKVIGKQLGFLFTTQTLTVPQTERLVQSQLITRLLELKGLVPICGSVRKRKPKHSSAWHRDSWS